MIDSWFWELVSVAGGTGVIIGVAVKWFVTKQRCAACRTNTDAELDRRPTTHDLRNVVSPLYNTLNQVVRNQLWNRDVLLMLAAHSKIEGVVAPPPVEEAEIPSFEGNHFKQNQ